MIKSMFRNNEFKDRYYGNLFGRELNKKFSFYQFFLITHLIKKFKISRK